MLLIECGKIKKYYGERLVLDVGQLNFYSEDRIGILGRNGIGKTTLMNILSKRLEPDEGWVKVYGKMGFISQLEEPDQKKISKEMASRFYVNTDWDEFMSGGEKTRFKIAAALNSDSQILLADEPTSNMDVEGIELLTQNLEEYHGAFIVISHDRNFLDRLCNQILEIEDGSIHIYNGNYSAFSLQKKLQKERKAFEYEEYVKEKRRLEKVILEKNKEVQSMKKTPNRMGNSEARLHKMGPQKAKANLDKAVKSVEKRIERLEVKEKYREIPGIKFDIMESTPLYSKIVVEGKQISKAFHDRVIFQDAEFALKNGSKIALLGPNGCGKSTLLRMIMQRDNGIKISQKAKIGYFSQNLNILNPNKSIFENVKESSIYPEYSVRLLLARLLFRGDEIYKKVEVLSGGEKVKVSFAKILLQDMNLLMLDEPTNYMDMDTLEVMEDSLKKYDRTILFVSHDRKFIDAIADHIMTIENRKINMFDGNYTEYMEYCNNKKQQEKNTDQNRILLLQHKLSDMIGRLSIPLKGDNREELEREYETIIKELKQLQHKTSENGNG